MYERGDVYFCFNGLRNPWARRNSGRYAAMLIQFAATPAEEIARLHDLWARELRLGIALQTSELRLTIKALRQDHPEEAWQALWLWLDDNMIDEIDHRVIGEFQSSAEWKSRERELFKKYASFDWAHPRAPRERSRTWMDLHCFTNTLEMLHRADRLFIANRPHWIGRKKRDASSQVDDIQKKLNLQNEEDS